MAGRGPGGSGADPESRPEPLVGLNGQVVVRVVADDARAGEVDPGGRGLVVLVRGPAIQPADEKGRTLLGSRTAPLPDTQDRSVLAPGRGEREVRSADPAASSGEREALVPIRDVRRWQGRTRSRSRMAAPAPPTASCGAWRGSGCTWPLHLLVDSTGLKLDGPGEW